MRFVARGNKRFEMDSTVVKHMPRVYRNEITTIALYLIQMYAMF